MTSADVEYELGIQVLVVNIVNVGRPGQTHVAVIFSTNCCWRNIVQLVLNVKSVLVV